MKLEFFGHLDLLAAQFSIGHLPLILDTEIEEEKAQLVTLYNLLKIQEVEEREREKDLRCTTHAAQEGKEKRLL